ncbi:hypothetical protein [Mesorhizobium sp. M1409]
MSGNLEIAKCLNLDFNQGGLLQGQTDATFSRGSGGILPAL